MKRVWIKKKNMYHHLSMEKNEAIERQIQLESMIFQGDISKITDIYKVIDYFDKGYLQNLLIYAASRQPFSYKFIGDIIEKVGKIDIKNFSIDTEFLNYLILRNLVSKDSLNDENEEIYRPIEIYENPINDATFAYFIQKDDLTGLLDIISQENIDIELEEITFNDQYFTFLDFACYCGSICILKHFILNDKNASIDDECLISSVKGGSENIIDFLSSQGYSFNNCLTHAIEYHQNSLAKWLFADYKDEWFTLPYCALCYNTELLLYFINEAKIDINQCMSNGNTTLHIAASTNNIYVVQFLIDKCVNKNSKNNEDKTPLELTCNENIKKLFD